MRCDIPCNASKEMAKIFHLHKLIKWYILVYSGVVVRPQRSPMLLA